MSAKENLIALLKSDQQTKEAMEKFEFGCKFIFDGIEFIYSGDKNADESILEGIESGDTKIIGFPLQERFIRMYCKNKHYECTFNLESIYISCCFSKIDGIYDDKSFLIGLDNTKDFDNQSEEVYSKIYEALLELNKYIWKK